MGVEPEMEMFWQTGHDDGMEFDINARQTQDILRGGQSLRPSFNAYMWADARAIAQNLGIGFETIAIERPFKAYLETLAPTFDGRDPDVTEENIQARIRGNILMALSNKFGHLVLSTALGLQVRGQGLGFDDFSVSYLPSYRLALGAAF